ncbi:MAG: aspartate/glutamate racemase family protein [Rhodothermaceae bacterium]|nr:aspartate/glutamate racemase family protein [Rhodothermaceae bacterium]MXZ58024.1 aspartate/glutamate racemase family protein [Rhodothermaceae bacterium]MYB91504.1 aspartate/glutamate racemase family protein [Rhodothermaceae bacterium]MYD69049.1 aspartate/glutamate racemase family protein [Rhodothermaceae bacterium]MYG43615.1 aspartate/glutamate racemase family protein [Rhodothermaceae bacterium]
MKNPVIGIIGGMGPQAGLDLAAKVIAQTRAVTDQDHLPMALLSYGHLIGDRSAYVFGESSENPGIAIASVARELSSLGVQVAGIPCNSAHAPQIFDELTRLSKGIRILHLIQETVRHIQETLPDMTRIGCLSTLSVHRLGLYRSALENAGYTPVMPTDEVAEQVVHRAIFDPGFGIKAHSAPVTDQARAMVLSAVAHCRSRGAESVILGCTELPLAVSHAKDIPLIDPACALARALIRETSPQKLVPL